MYSSSAVTCNYIFTCNEPFPSGFILVFVGVPVPHGLGVPRAGNRSSMRVPMITKLQHLYQPIAKQCYQLKVEGLYLKIGLKYEKGLNCSVNSIIS